MNNSQAIVFAPQDISRLSLQEIDRRSKAKGEGVPFYVDALDRLVNPMRPGDLSIVMARPGHWKTSLALWTARQEASTIYKAREQGASGAFGDCVVYVTWEIAVEEAGILDLSNAAQVDIADIARGDITDEQWKMLKVKAANRAAFPLWVMGHSLENRRERPTLTLKDVQAALDWMEDEMKVKPGLIVLDYLQAISQDEQDRNTRRMQITADVQRSKNMGYRAGAPVLACVQANRDVDDRQNKVPLQGDGMESASIEHVPDKIITSMYPIKYYGEGDQVEVGNKQVLCNQEVLVTNVAKQRYGPIGGPQILKVDPTTNTVKGEFVAETLADKFDNRQEEAWTQANLNT
jgi:replicative DNA helicase